MDLDKCVGLGEADIPCLDFVERINDILDAELTVRNVTEKVHKEERDLVELALGWHLSGCALAELYDVAGVTTREGVRQKILKGERAFRRTWYHIQKRHDERIKRLTRYKPYNKPAKKQNVKSEAQSGAEGASAGDYAHTQANTFELSMEATGGEFGTEVDTALSPFQALNGYYQWIPLPAVTAEQQTLRNNLNCPIMFGHVRLEPGEMVMLTPNEGEWFVMKLVNNVWMSVADI